MRHACTRCGILVWERDSMCRDCRFVTMKGVTMRGHETIAEPMRDGGYRAECGCGEFADFQRYADARTWVTDHERHVEIVERLTRERFGTQASLEAERVS
jgi:hypothetical protein